MSSTEECLAGLRLLVCMAKADGVLRADERFALEDALAGVALPEGLSLEALLAETNDPCALAKKITTQDGRDSAYAAAYAMAHCDRELAETETQILNTLREAWNIDPKDERRLGEALDRAVDPVQASTGAVTDSAERKRAFDTLLKRYCILTAVTGAIPLPLVPDLAVVPMQVKMVYDVAALFGQITDKRAIQLMFETLGVGTGVRIGVSILSKMVPGWGSLVGSTSAFAATYALAQVAWKYFEMDGKSSFESLKPLFREQQAAGRKEFDKNKVSLQEAATRHQDQLSQLAFELTQGKISQQEYERKVDELK